ncbi:hypothetical protein KPH14_013094, partial [Odynerus spinipes]
MYNSLAMSGGSSRKSDFVDLLDALREFYQVLFERQMKLDALLYVLSSILLEKSLSLSSSRKKSFRHLTRDFFVNDLREFLMKYLPDVNALTLEEKHLLLKTKCRLSCTLHFNHDLTSVLSSVKANGLRAWQTGHGFDILSSSVRRTNDTAAVVTDAATAVNGPTYANNDYDSSIGNNPTTSSNSTTLDLINLVSGNTVAYFDETSNCAENSNEILRRRNVYSMETLRSSFVLYTVTDLAQRAILSCSEREIFLTDAASTSNSRKRSSGGLVSRRKGRTRHSSSGRRSVG